jgi:hypothetical protein
VSRTVDRHSGKLLGELSGFNGMNCALSEIFIAGTEPSGSDDSHKTATICAHSGYLATPFCPNTVTKVYTVRPGGMSWERMIAEYQFRNQKVENIPDAIYDLPEYYCPLHNPSPDIYPVSPLGRTLALYNPNNVTPVDPDVELDENGNPIPTGSAIGMPDDGQPVDGGGVIDPMYNDPDTVGGQDNQGGENANTGEGSQTGEDGEGQGGNPPDGGGEGQTGEVTNPDPDVNVWDDNYLSEDPNF